ncbi:hypothetical protein Gasu2_20340 [Galdieria sulphuraria]|uniref:Uncharacterized protein n=1 Tax=Galdieria sulphuraria TaxID=130081 RepID=M2XM44_GALSU|nr:uncharacterized protein Gasu_15070 [Galdieria sulphuraria]EME31267.1 hypothetical protein Gasu_15070 [Galdieria sulphuraria]GJD07689.1 hypothetical protein Gasu2_20340 [Galdieria sulphuraria]|eukprot:XP_005707787.1 hypothetical protein Gasu_15070 [Galdieria sulphuraria]
MIGVIAGPCYFVIQCFGPVFMSANVADRGESSQNNENKPHISSSAKVDNSKRSERIMRWSSQHNSMIPILKFYKDGERKYGHWEEKKERNIVSICDGVLKHATASYRLEVSRDNGLVESFSSICQEAPYGLPNEVLLCIEELFDSCIAFIHKWLLNGYTSILSNDCPYVKKLPIYRFPSIVSSYIRIVYAAAFSSGSMIEHLAYFLDERCLHFLVRTFSRFVEWEDYEMERAFLTALADYLWMLFVLVSRNEGLMPENFSSRQRIFECNKYPQWKFQAKQLIEVFFEKEELHSPVIAYFKSFKARKGHSRPFLDLCVQLLSTLIGLHQVLEQVSGGNLSVERTKRKRRKQANNDEELSAVRNMESHAKKVVHRPSDLLMTPLIRSQTFELLLLPFHNILSNHFVSEAKNVAIHKSLSILCRLCYMALKRLWKIACSRKLRPQLYSATFIAFFYALTLPEAELRFSIVFKDHGEFLSGLRSLSKDISDSFVETFRQNIVVAVDALFPMNSATCSYYENMTRREETESTSRTRKKHRKALRRSNLESLRTEESSPSMRVSRTEIDNINYLVEGSNDQLSSQNCVRRRIRVINDNDDD